MKLSHRHKLGTEDHPSMGTERTKAHPALPNGATDTAVVHFEEHICISQQIGFEFGPSTLPTVGLRYIWYMSEDKWKRDEWGLALIFRMAVELWSSPDHWSPKCSKYIFKTYPFDGN